MGILPRPSHRRQHDRRLSWNRLRWAATVILDGEGTGRPPAGEPITSAHLLGCAHSAHKGKNDRYLITSTRLRNSLSTTQTHTQTHAHTLAHTLTYSHTHPQLLKSFERPSTSPPARERRMNRSRLETGSYIFRRPSTWVFVQSLSRLLFSHLDN